MGKLEEIRNMLFDAATRIDSHILSESSHELTQPELDDLEKATGQIEAITGKLNCAHRNTLREDERANHDVGH